MKSNKKICAELLADQSAEELNKKLKKTLNKIQENGEIIKIEYLIKQEGDSTYAAYTVFITYHER